MARRKPHLPWEGALRSAQRLAWWVLWAVGVGLSSGCSYYSQSEGERLRDEVYELRQQISSLQETLERVEANQAEADVRLQQRLDEASEKAAEARRYDADVGVVLNQLREDLARLRGQVEGIDQRTIHIEEEAQAEAARVAAEEEARKAEEQRKKAAVESRSSLLTKPKLALEEAQKLIDGGQAAEGRALVEALREKQRGQRGWKVYAPKATYLIGESYFVQKDWRKAAAAFNQVRKEFPKNRTWMPSTLLRLGMCFENLGLKDDAKLFYQSAAQKYPRHPAGREAKRRAGKL